MIVAVVAAVLSAAEICRPQGDRQGRLPAGVSARRAQCLMCPSTAATPPRPNTTYLVNGKCDWDVVTPGTLNIGAYTMAAHQQLVSLHYYKSLSGEPAVGTNGVVLAGSLRVATAGCAVYSLNLTASLTAKATSVAGLDVYGVHVDKKETAVLILNDVGKDTVDATGAKIRGATGGGQAVVAMVHVTGPRIEIMCSDPQNIVAVQNFVATDKVSVACQTLNLTSLFDVMGSAATAAMYDTPPPQWLLTLQSFNVRGTGWLILVTILFFVVRPPPKEKSE